MHPLVPCTTIPRSWTAQCLSLLALGIVVQLGCGAKESGPEQAQSPATAATRPSGIVAKEGVNAQAATQTDANQSNSLQPADATKITPTLTSTTNAATPESALLQSETVHDGTEVQLHHIADWLTPGNSIAQQVIEHLASDDFRCSALRPKELEVVHADTAIEIRRPRPRPPITNGGEAANTVARFQGK